MEKHKINYYKTYSDDFVKSKKQDYKLPNNYKWIHTNIFYKIYSAILYKIAYIFGFFYCKFALHVKVENRDVLKKHRKQGYFLYGNHTQPIGDVFMPTRLCKSKRIFVIASPSNLGVDGIGPFLPMIGILPIPDSIIKMKKLLQAVEQRIQQNKCVVIYPEAHVWPYYTKIRPFESTAFKFPIENNAKSFCMTTTYYKRKFGKKPGIKIYVDGPFISDDNLSKKQRQEYLSDKIYQCMKYRSKSSNYEYIEYKEENE